MKAYLQNAIADTSMTPALQYGVLFYMGGTPPTNQVELDALVDLKSSASLHEKCLGAGAVSGPVTYDQTGIGKFKTTYSAQTDNMSWLKKASIPIGSAGYYWQVPDKFYREDGINDISALPVGVGSMPILNTNFWNSAVWTAQVPPTMRYRESLNSTFTTAFIFEYDTAVDISAIWRGPADATYASQYFYYVKVETWDGSAWVVQQTNAYINMNSQITFAAAVSTTKVRVTMTTYTQGGDIFTTILGAIMPLSKVQRAATAVPNITWGVLVPATSNSRSSNASLDMSDATVYSEVALKTRDYSRSIVHMNKTTSYMPAIIDTASDDGASKMVLSKSSNLMSTDRPTLMTYKYTAGDFV
jgi:hypothetical protein